MSNCPENLHKIPRKTHTESYLAPGETTIIGFFCEYYLYFWEKVPSQMFDYVFIKPLTHEVTESISNKITDLRSVIY